MRCDTCNKSRIDVKKSKGLEGNFCEKCYFKEFAKWTKSFKKRMEAKK